MKRLGQQDLLRQMLGIEWTEPAQLLHHFGCDSLGLAIFRAAMHDAMPHRRKCIMPAAFLDTIDQRAHRGVEIRRRHGPRKVVARVQAFHPQRSPRLPDPVNPAPQNPSERFTGLKQRELDARRASINRQDARVTGFHG